MKKLIFFALFFNSSVFAASPAQELKPALIKRCIAQGSEYHAHTEYVHTYCNCSWGAISETLTLAEYVQLEATQSAKGNVKDLPFMHKLLPRLKACREQAAKVHMP